MLRRGRILGRLREGYAYDEIARKEQLTPERAPPDRAEALARRVVEDETDHAKLQLARLAQAMQIASIAVADGDVRAIPALLKVLDRLDRYQRAAKVNQVYDDEARKRLIDKINRVAANLGLDEPRTAIEGPAQSPEPREAAGPAAEKQKMAWGVGASLKRGSIRRRKRKLFFGSICLGFAGFGSNFARRRCPGPQQRAGSAPESEFRQ